MIDGDNIIKYPLISRTLYGRKGGKNFLREEICWVFFPLFVKRRSYMSGARKSKFSFFFSLFSAYYKKNLSDFLIDKIDLTTQNIVRVMF